MAPRTTAPAAAPLVASAGVPGVQMGANLNDAGRMGRAFMDTLRAMGSMALRPGMKVPVATASVQFPDEGFLDGNASGNLRKLERATSPAAITAAGGICVTPAPRYDYPLVATADRPVRAALTRFGADRGGVLLPTIPTLADVDGASGFWTLDDDVAAVDDDEVRKGCLRVDCGDDVLTEVYAIVQCLEVGNFNQRTGPERIAAITELAAAMTARKAESRLLTTIGSLSTQVTVPQNLGAARDILATLDRATAQLRNRHRTPLSMPLRYMAPAWLRSMIRTDLTREMPGSADERLALADATIDSFFAARNVNVTWFLDGEAGQVFGSQADGPLLGWIPNVVSYLFPEGAFIFLDGGELNLGLVRDSVLNSRNDFQMFSEVFENVAFHGVESLRLSMNLCPSGASAGTLEPVCDDVDAS